MRRNFGTDEAWYAWSTEIDARVKQLEKHIHYPHNEVAMKEAAKAQNAPLTDARIFEITKLADFGDIEFQCRDFPADKALAIARVRKLLELAAQTPHNEVAMKEAAAKAQAQPEPMQSYARMQAQTIISEVYPPPMRADTEAILALTKFAKRLLNPEDLGHAVTFEVRQLARRALGLPEVKEYDL